MLFRTNDMRQIMFSWIYDTAAGGHESSECMLPHTMGRGGVPHHGARSCPRPWGDAHDVLSPLHAQQAMLTCSHQNPGCSNALVRKPLYCNCLAGMTVCTFLQVSVRAATLTNLVQYAVD